MAAPAPVTETQANQHLIAAKGAAGTKAAAAAGLDAEAIREVMTAKAAAAKAAAAGAKGAMVGGVPVGVEPGVFRQALAAQTGGGKVAAATVGTKAGMVGVEPDIIREAVVSKAIGGAGAMAAGKGAGTALAASTPAAAEAVTTGTCLIPLPVKARDHVTADFGPLGSVDVRFGN